MVAHMEKPFYTWCNMFMECVVVSTSVHCIKSMIPWEIRHKGGENKLAVAYVAGICWSSLKRQGTLEFFGLFLWNFRKAKLWGSTFPTVHRVSAFLFSPTKFLIVCQASIADSWYRSLPNWQYTPLKVDSSFKIPVNCTSWPARLHLRYKVTSLDGPSHHLFWTLNGRMSKRTRPNWLCCHSK